MPGFSVFRPRDEEETRFLRQWYNTLLIVFVALAMISILRLFAGVSWSEITWLDWFMWWPMLLMFILTQSVASFGLSVPLSFFWWFFMSVLIADVLMIVRRSRLDKRTPVAETD